MSSLPFDVPMRGYSPLSSPLEPPLSKNMLKLYIRDTHAYEWVYMIKIPEHSFLCCLCLLYIGSFVTMLSLLQHNQYT